MGRIVDSRVVGRRLCRFTSVLIAGLCIALAPLPAHAKGKPHCRDLTFDGAAGPGSHDKVYIRVVDAYGVVIEDACQLTVTPDETHTEFAGRIAGMWGDGNGVVCPSDAGGLTKTCGTGLGGRACKHKFIFKTKKDGTIKKEILRICCYENADCKGPRLGKSDPFAVPITVQSQVLGRDPDPVPSPVPAGVVVAQMALDPIGMTQQPHAALLTCRDKLGVAAKAIEDVVGRMVSCHIETMNGGNQDGFDCNDPWDIPVSEEKTVAGVFEEAVDLAVDLGCREQGDPANFGYTECPPPCEASISTWDDVAACIKCVAEDAAGTAVTETFGYPGPELPAGAKACQKAIGSGLRSVFNTHLTEIVRCQSSFDGGRQTLPDGTNGVCTQGLVGTACTSNSQCDTSQGAGDGVCFRHCRYADLRGHRAAAEAKVAAILQTECDASALEELTTCGQTPSEVGMCVPAEALTAAQQVSDAVFPEGIPPQ